MTKKTNKTPHTAERQSLAEVLASTTLEIIEVADKDWEDFEVDFSCKDPDIEEFEDSYDSFMFLLASLTPVEEVYRDSQGEASGATCDFTAVLWRFKDVFEEFFNEHNREGYRPMDYPNCRFDEDSGFAEAYLYPLEYLIVGGYIDECYQDLYEKLTAAYLRERLGQFRWHLEKF